MFGSITTYRFIAFRVSPTAAVEVYPCRDILLVMSYGYGAQRFHRGVSLVLGAGLADRRHEFVIPFRADGFLTLAA